MAVIDKIVIALLVGTYTGEGSADRDSNRIEVYRIDPESGLLEDTGERINLSKPVCVKFL